MSAKLLSPKADLWLAGRGERARGTEGRNVKGSWDFWGDGYVHYLDCEEGFTGIYICQNLLNYMLWISPVYCISFITQ